jgi:hypothetical protein
MTRKRAHVNMLVRNRRPADSPYSHIQVRRRGWYRSEQMPEKGTDPWREGPVFRGGNETPGLAGRQTGWNRGVSLRRAVVRTSGLGELGLLDDLVLEARGHLLILEEFHAETPLALRHAS